MQIVLNITTPAVILLILIMQKNGIAFVRVDDWELAKSFGVHALPALLYFKYVHNLLILLY